MEPRFAEELGKMQCFFRNCGELTLLHTHDPALLAPLLGANAFLTRLEGEWWLRFHCEPVQAPAAKGWLVRACQAAVASTTEPLLRT